MKIIRLDVAIQNIPSITLYEKSGYRYVETVDFGLGYEHLVWFKLYELNFYYYNYYVFLKMFKGDNEEK